MDMAKQRDKHAPMARRIKPFPVRPVKAFRPLYIGQWIRALGMTPAEVARGTGMNEGYLSQLISGDKKNPSGATLSLLAGHLGIPIDYLYRPTPDREFIEKAGQIDPSVLARLKPH
jgi:transcriptional regulator with XRE-family HTH domain